MLVQVKWRNKKEKSMKVLALMFLIALSAEAATTNITTNAVLIGIADFSAVSWTGSTNSLGSHTNDTDTGFWDWKEYSTTSLRPAFQEELGGYWQYVAAGINTNGEYAWTDWLTEMWFATNSVSYTTNIWPDGPPPPPPPPPTP